MAICRSCISLLVSVPVLSENTYDTCTSQAEELQDRVWILTNASYRRWSACPSCPK